MGAASSERFRRSFPALLDAGEVCDTTYQLVRKDGSIIPARFVSLEVSDTGCGMNEETQQRIFDPFFSTKFSGLTTGLRMMLELVPRVIHALA